MKDSLSYPSFGLGKPTGISDELIVEEVKQEATILVGPYNQKENDSYVKCCPNQVRVNRCFLEMGVQYGAREAAREKRGWNFRGLCQD